MKFFDAESASDIAKLRDRGERHIATEARKVAAGDWIIYQFRDERGKVLFEKCRIPLGGGEKTFRYRQWAPVEPHGHAWDYHKPREADRYLYNLPDLLRAKASGADIWWTEGEKDAGRLEEELEGADCAVSHHQAAGNSTPEQAEWFRGHRGDVILLYDRDEDDEAGRNPGAYDVIKRYDQLRAVGLKRSQIYVACAAVGKDIHDHLSAGRSLDELSWVTDLGPLRERHDRGGGFGRWGYVEEDPELTEALGKIQRDGWQVKVEKRNG